MAHRISRFKLFMVPTWHFGVNYRDFAIFQCAFKVLQGSVGSLRDPESHKMGLGCCVSLWSLLLGLGALWYTLGACGSR